MKHNDSSEQLKNITGYSDADLAGDPVTRESTSCILCSVDQFLLASECRRQGTVALSSGESELYALGAPSAELCKLGSPTLADLTRAKKALSYVKGTRDLKTLPDDTGIKTE